MISFAEKFLYIFYIADRNKTTFQHEEEVPYLVPQVVPIFFILILLEIIFTYLKKGKLLRVNDGMTSLALGMTMELTKLFTKGIEVIGYQWLYEYRFFTLDWQSPWTWWAAAIGVDLGYYWIHRTAHEISLFWCGHQAHHSSEEYNLYTALRQSAFQHLFSIGFYQPLALLGVPLPALLVHMQLNLFYQFWIHTELIGNLGPLEWILNTPSHHRVHHGINKWCLDKNYAGFLIIWDRMFGTFEPERKDENIVYGLISQPQTFEPLYLQVFYFKQTLQKAFSMETWSDSFKALFYGPGWNPGTPRLGDEDAIPNETPVRAKYNPKLPAWVNYFLFGHFMMVIAVQQYIAINFATFNWWTILAFLSFIFLSLFTIGNAFNKKWWVPFIEALRCIGTVAILRQKSITGLPMADLMITGYFACSVVIWSSRSLSILSSGKLKEP